MAVANQLGSVLLAGRYPIDDVSRRWKMRPPAKAFRKGILMALNSVRLVMKLTLFLSPPEGGLDLVTNRQVSN